MHLLEGIQNRSAVSLKVRVDIKKNATVQGKIWKSGIVDHILILYCSLFFDWLVEWSQYNIQGITLGRYVN